MVFKVLLRRGVWRRIQLSSRHALHDLHEVIASNEGKGAFRRFKDTVQRYGIENRWYSYREEVLKNIAINWCENNNISYHL